MLTLALTLALSRSLRRAFLQNTHRYTLGQLVPQQECREWPLVATRTRDSFNHRPRGRVAPQKLSVNG